MNVDLLVTGGTVWTPLGLVKADVLISNGKVVAVEPAAGATAERVIDATGKYVIPGGIDTHTHQRDPGFTHKEDLMSATRAAAAGGYTVSVGMPNVEPPTITLEDYERVIEIGKQRSLVDFNHNPSGTNPQEVPKLAEAGCLAFKIFMGHDTVRDYPHMPGLALHSHRDLLKSFEAVERTGLPLMVHPHDQDLMDEIEQRYWRKNDHSPEAYAKAYQEFDGIIWDTAVGLLLRLQKATQARLHILHTCTPWTIQAARLAKAESAAVTFEVNPWALFLGSSWENIERLGPYALGFWVPDDNVEILWQAINDGTIDVIGTDHAPHTHEEKEVGWEDMWKAPGGEPQIQDCLPLFLDAVNKGKTSLDTVVRMFAYNPARIFGLYPTKGVLQEGADADLVIVDMDAEATISNSTTYTKVGWTPYDGQQVKGMPTHTILRGELIMEQGQVLGSPGNGKFVTRQHQGSNA